MIDESQSPLTFSNYNKAGDGIGYADPCCQKCKPHHSVRDIESTACKKRIQIQNSDIVFFCIEMNDISHDLVTHSEKFLLICENLFEWSVETYLKHLSANGKLCLTHCGLVRPYGDRDLGQHWLR